MDPADVAAYERIRARISDGVPVAELSGARCEGCRTDLPTGFVQRVRREPAPLPCPSCGRLLHGAGRDAARRRLTDSRIRLEDAIVGAHRHGLMHLLRTDDRLSARGPNPGTSMDIRTALVTYLSIVGTRPRDVVIDTAYATVIAASDPSRRVWEDRRSFMETLLPELRSLYRRYEATLADPAPRNGFSRSHAGGRT